jgi:hypothetical protein
MVHLTSYKHSPEESEGEQPWTIHVPVPPTPAPDDRRVAELDDDEREDEREAATMNPSADD